MDTLLVRRLGNELLEKYNLKEKGWKFGIDTSNKSYGRCDYKNKVIFLSKVFCLTITDFEIKDTILHEIAHIMCPNHGHDDVWKKTAISIGCSGNICGDVKSDAVSKEKLDLFNKVKFNFKVECLTCKTISYRNIKPANDISCGKCSRVFDRRFLLKITKNT